MPNYYTVTHHWSGVSTEYLVVSDGFPTVKQVVRCLNLSFEPELGERIEIGEAYPLDGVVLLDLIEEDGTAEDDLEPSHRGRRPGEFCAKCGGDCEYDADGELYFNPQEAVEDIINE